MTKECESFYNYIISNKSESIDKFKQTFNDRFDQLPDRVVSSKSILKNLTINNKMEFKIFQNTFLEYFKYKLKYLKLKGIMTDNYILNGGQSNKTRNLNTNILNVDVLTQTPSMLDMYGYTFSDRDQVDTLNKLLNNASKTLRPSLSKLIFFSS